MTRPKLNIPPGVTVVSPSQISTAEECWRKWGFAYIQGKREPGGRGAAFGGVVHERHEAYLEHGTVPDRAETWTFRAYLEAEARQGVYHGRSGQALQAQAVIANTSDAQLDKQMFPGKVALNMMPQGIYPAPGTGEVEKHFVYKRTPKIWYQGMIDWHVYDAPSRRLKVIDHKTSSDPGKYGLTDETMRTNKQVLIYARALLEEHECKVTAIGLYWSYGKSDGVAKHSYVAEAHFDYVGEVYARFENDVHPWAVEIHRLKTMGADPLSLDPNPNSCWLYNQECSHARECNLTSADKIGALMSNATSGNSLLQGLLAGANANAAASTPTAPGTPSNPAAPPLPPPPAPGDVVSPPEAAGPVATAPALPLPVAKPAAAPPASAPLPPVAGASAAIHAVPPTPPVSPPTPQPAVPPVASAPPVAPAPVATAAPQAQPVLEIPENFWNVVAQGVINKIVEALTAGLSK